MGNRAPISPLTALRRQLHTGRDARRARRRLAHELGHYRTAGDLQELGAILDRHPSAQTAEVRRILGHRAAQV